MLQDLISDRFDYFEMDEFKNMFNVRDYIAPTTLLSSGDSEFMNAMKNNPRSPIYQAMADGADFHTSIERGVGVDPHNQRLLDYFNANVVCDIDEVWGLEKAVVSHPNRMKGIFDGAGIFRGRRTIWDYKKVNKLKTPSKIKKYMKQLASYAICHDEMYGWCGGQIDQVVLVQIGGKRNEDISHRINVIDGDELQSWKDEYLADVTQWWTTHKKPEYMLV